MIDVELPARFGSYDVLAALAPAASSYLGIGVQEGVCVEHVVRTQPTVNLTLCDTWGLTHGGTGRGSHAHIDRKLIALGHLGSVVYLDGASAELIPTLRGRSFDLAYVDGDHSEAAAMTDLLNTWPLVTGAMVVHDIRMATVWAALTRFLDTAGEASVRCCAGGHGTAVVFRR